MHGLDVVARLMDLGNGLGVCAIRVDFAVSMSDTERFKPSDEFVIGQTCIINQAVAV